jgi:orotate phosphoribosyltransferase
MAEEKIKELKARLLALLKKDAFRRGKFVLSSGKSSDYYLDGRIVTLSSEGAYLVGSIILGLIKDKGITAIGGPTIGADPIVGAAVALAHLRNLTLKAFIVRKSAKNHGSKRQIEGPALKPDEKVLLVDDVATTGKALLEAKQALDKIGVKIEATLVIVDRQEGAGSNLEKEGLKLEALFTIEDFRQ